MLNHLPILLLMILFMDAVVGNHKIESESEFVILDIHIPLTGESCVATEVHRFNSILKAGSRSEAINFENIHTPHITLYQTKFHTSQIEQIKGSLDEAISSSPISTCSVQLDSKVFSGEYAMLSFVFDHESTNCLQQLSDIVVTTLLPFVKFPADIPDWVLNITDESIRKRKMELVEHYGSPNVFDGFDPHCTVGFDDKDPHLLEQLMNGIELRGGCDGYFDTIAIGNVGIGGSVLQGALYEKKLGHSVVTDIL